MAKSVRDSLITTGVRYATPDAALVARLRDWLDGPELETALGCVVRRGDVDPDLVRVVYRGASPKLRGACLASPALPVEMFGENLVSADISAVIDAGTTPARRAFLREFADGFEGTASDLIWLVESTFEHDSATASP